MKAILNKILFKRGIKNFNELSDEEKGTFQKWDRILSEGEVTVDSIKEFCQNQKAIIETGWKDLKSDPLLNERRIIAHVIYSTLLEIIDKPNAERENLEKHLNQLLDSQP